MVFAAGQMPLGGCNNLAGHNRKPDRAGLSPARL